MKKSCSLKESKSVKCNKGSQVLNEFNDSGPKQPNNHSNRFHADKKLKEGARKGEQTGLLEEENTCKGTSFSTNSDRAQRTSPRLAKSSAWNASKWIDNSFDGQKKEGPVDKSKCDKNKTDIITKNPQRKVIEISIKNDASGGSQDRASGISDKKLVQSEIDLGVRDTGSIQKTNDVVVSDRKSQYEKVQVIENSAKNDKNSSLRSLSPNFVVGKKRITSCDKSSTGSPKKIKMEESDNNDNSNNNEGSGDCDQLKIELEIENRQKDAVVALRDVEMIIAECESRNQKWKETYLKYDCPTRWGTPIVRQSAEKWDGSYIPPKLLERYQKFLISRDLTHPIFLPTGSQIHFVPNEDATPDFGSDLNVDLKSDGENSGGRELEESQDTCPDSQGSMTDNSGRMVLRNRNQYRPVVVEDDEDLSDDSDEWSTKTKSAKSKTTYRGTSKTNSKNKKASLLNNQQLITSMERCNINRKNGMKTDDLLGNSSSLEDDTDSKAAAFIETMVCPICSLRFPKQQIESHATECASKTYKD